MTRCAFPLLFEISKPGRKAYDLPALDVPRKDGLLPDAVKAEKALHLPELAEVDLVRHFVGLSRRNFGVDNGFYPLGSCTMKYNPKIDEEVCNNFSGLHPFADRARGEYEPEGRHAALLVHSVGRKLSDCAETVGFAYQITGREDLGRHGAAFVYAMAKEYPSTRPEIAKGFAGGRGDVMHGLALGYDWLGDAMTDAQRQEVAAVAKGYLEQFGEEFENPKNWWYKVHNYNGVNGGAAGCLALALHDAYPNEYQAWV
ncbi:MAG: hypothetical protein EOM66_01515, partial [Clostridia bacterium]|nr:hypothetical protein [Clostridia bacterium]